MSVLLKIWFAPPLLTIRVNCCGKCPRELERKCIKVPSDETPAFSPSFYLQDWLRLRNLFEISQERPLAPCGNRVQLAPDSSPIPDFHLNSVTTSRVAGR